MTTVFSYLFLFIWGSPYLLHWLAENYVDALFQRRIYSSVEVYIHPHSEVNIYFIKLFCFLFFSDWIHEIIQEISTIASIRRNYLNYPGTFYDICGWYTVPRQRMNLSGFLKRAEMIYFKFKVRDQMKSCFLYNVCKLCVENLRR